MFTTDSLDPKRVRAARLELHNKLMGILGTSGEAESRVYYQPPASVRMKYPAIRYERDGSDFIHANDRVYRGKQRYTVTVIDPDPDSRYAAMILRTFPYAAIDRSYTADNLNHDVLTLYY